MSLLGVYGVKSFKSLIPYIIIIVCCIAIGYFKLRLDTVIAKNESVTNQLEVAHNELINSLNQNELLQSLIDKQNAELKLLSLKGKEAKKAYNEWVNHTKEVNGAIKKVLNMKAKTCPQIKEKLKVIGGLSYESL